MSDTTPAIQEPMFAGYQGEHIRISALQIPNVEGKIEFNTKILERYAQLVGLNLVIAFGSVSQDKDIVYPQGSMQGDGTIVSSGLAARAHSIHTHGSENIQRTGQEEITAMFPDSRILKRQVIIDKEAIAQKLLAEGGVEENSYKDLTRWAEELNTALHCEICKAGIDNTFTLVQNPAFAFILQFYWNFLLLYHAIPDAILPSTWETKVLNVVFDILLYKALYLGPLMLLRLRLRRQGYHITYRNISVFNGMHFDRLAILLLLNGGEFTPDVVRVAGERRGISRRLRQTVRNLKNHQTRGKIDDSDSLLHS